MWIRRAKCVRSYWDKPYIPCNAKQKLGLPSPSLLLRNKFKVIMSRMTYIGFQHTTAFFTRRNVEIFLAEKLLIDFQITIWPHFHTKARIWAWASHLDRFNSPCPLQCPHVQISTFSRRVGLVSIYMTIIQLNTDSIISTIKILLLLLVQCIHVLRILATLEKRQGSKANLRVHALHSILEQMTVSEVTAL